MSLMVEKKVKKNRKTTDNKSLLRIAVTNCRKDSYKMSSNSQQETDESFVEQMAYKQMDLTIDYLKSDIKFIKYFGDRLKGDLPSDWMDLLLRSLTTSATPEGMSISDTTTSPLDDNMSSDESNGSDSSMRTEKTEISID
ncbi:uncharacterized protein LOC128956282 isoform X2 [Oppia nitens]|uniref:uncharacterized protein LOC128956282 isoform X2 n=1 Tax=Oppia nitens TaxID=1686743 RepID=UPI0023DC9A4E|nr:uncharacterized protein LOC128956282 isoform X2 [Oppia nitens]